VALLPGETAADTLPMQSVPSWRTATPSRWLVAATLAGAVAGLSILSGTTIWSYAHRERIADAQRSAAAAGQIIELHMQALHNALVRLDERRIGACDDLCEQDVAAYLRDMPELVELGWLGQSTDEDVLFLRASAAAGAVGPAPGAASIEKHLASLRGAPTSSRAQLRRAGHQRLTLSTASSAELRRAIAVVDIDAMVRRSLGEAARETLAVHVDGEQTLDPRSVADDGVTGDATRTIHGAVWQFVVTQPAAAAPFLTGLILFGGFLTSALIVIALLWPPDRTATSSAQPPIVQDPAAEHPASVSSEPTGSILRGPAVAP